LALTSVWFYLGYEQNGGRWRYAAAIAAFLLSALAKGEALTLPIVLLALAWWQRGRIARRDVLRVVPYFLIAACMAGVEIWTQRLLEAEVIRTDNLFSRTAIAGIAVWFYFWKVVWPVNLIPFYPRWTIDSGSLLAYLPCVMLLAALGLAWWQRRTWGRPVVMLIVCYVALLLPALGFVNIYYMRYSFVADHWQYAATVVPCAVFAGVFVTLTRRFWPRPAAYLGAASLLVVLGILSFYQSRTYADNQAFYETSIAGNRECWLAHYNLGELLGGGGELDAAMAHFRAALAIKPDHAKAHNGLGMALLGHGQVEPAIAEFRKALEIDPDEAEAHYNLGNMLLARGELDSAIDHFRKSLKIKPNDAAAHNNLGNALLRRGDDLVGISHCQRALELRPDFAEAAFNLGDAMLRRGQLGWALTYFRRALEIRPSFVEARYDLATVLARRGEFDLAIDEYKQVLKIRPDDASARQNLNAAESERNDILNSLAEKRAATRLHPGDAARLNAVAWTLATNPNASIRNGAEAVEVALRANKLSGGNDPAILGTLAAAYAETGRFADAVRTADEAQRLATIAGNRPLAEQNRVRKDVYKSGQPYRELRGE
jgi:Flp pilus assembly protein TadD